MFGTIESTHNKILDKIKITTSAVQLLSALADKYKKAAGRLMGHKYTSAIDSLDNIDFSQLLTEITNIESNYILAVVNVLNDYYTQTDLEGHNTHEYYKIIISENFIMHVDDVIIKIKQIIALLRDILSLHILSDHETSEGLYELDDALKTLDRASVSIIDMKLERRPYEICNCGTRMIVVPELSELHCGNKMCGIVKTIIGAVFRDDQFYPQEGQKTKHGGYDSSRHYRFWMERLQARETKTFTDEELNNVEYVIKRDGYRTSEITCARMRYILKDPKVNATYLNDHVPLLVKTFGGRPPPQLDFQEDRICSIRFSKAMKLYETVNPDGGNKPYYPYFIYKIIEELFKDNPEKLRMLDYIHLQSRETVIKNDKYYEHICALSGPQDGLVYRSTDPACRL